MQRLRIGYGEDAHRLTEGRALVLGGVAVDDAPRGAEAHSDGDVLLHALGDALLGAFALGDIGVLFPASDEAFRDLPGLDLLRRVLRHLEDHAPAHDLLQVAAVVTLDRPKLAPWRDRIAAALAHACRLPRDRVGIGFKTSEGLAPDHVQARVTVLIYGREA